MATALEHYERLLAEHYTWLYGGWDAKVEENRACFRELGLLEGAGKTAIDLGCGPGFQSIPLAEAGYDVYAVDVSPTLLSELRHRAEGLPIVCVEADLLAFMQACPAAPDVIVCMTDTLLHLSSKREIDLLFAAAAGTLKAGGALVVSYRENAVEPPDLERIIPVRSDASTIFTCLLEYEPEHVKVFDLVYRREGEGWALRKSLYRKVRVSTAWVKESMERQGLRVTQEDVARGMTRLVAVKR